MLFTIIVPARFESTRLPGKPLKLIDGRPMVQWVYEVCKNIKGVREVIIATDHPKIKEVVKDFGGQVVMTSKEHVSGTDRCAEVAQNIEAEYVINVQGDEPFIKASDIEKMMHYLVRNPKVEIVTLFHEIPSIEAEKSSNVKLIRNKNGKILYFSRAKIPFERNEYQSHYLKHIGIYAFKRRTLMHLSTLEPSALELAEGLEQLRWLENGGDIYGLEVKEGNLSIDTEEDLIKARAYAEGLSKY